MSRLFILLTVSFFSFFCSSDESLCPNTIYLAQLDKPKQNGSEIRKNCVSAFENEFGNAWLYLENQNFETIKSSSYLQKVLVSMYLLDDKKTLEMFEDHILKLMQLNPALFFDIVWDGRFQFLSSIGFIDNEEDTITVKDFFTKLDLNTDIGKNPALDIVLSYYKDEISIYDALNSEHFKDIPAQVSHEMFESTLSDQNVVDSIDVEILKEYVKFIGPVSGFIYDDDIFKVSNGMYFALNSDNFELGLQIIEDFESKFFPIFGNEGQLIKNQMSLALVNSDGLNTYSNIPAAQDIIKRKNYLIQMVKENSPDPDELRYDNPTRTTDILNSDKFLSLFVLHNCNDALEGFSDIFNRFKNQLDYIQSLEGPIEEVKRYHFGYEGHLFNDENPTLLPLFASICAFESNKYIEAKQYLDFSNQALQYLGDYIDPTVIALYEILLLYSEIDYEDMSDTLDGYNDFIAKYRDKSSIYILETYQGQLLELLINQVFKIFSILTDSDVLPEEIYDPLSIFSLKMQINSGSEFNNLLLSKSSNDLNKNQSEYLRIREELFELEKELLTNFDENILNEIEQLSSQKNTYLQKIYQSNSAIDSIHNPKYPSISKLLSHSFTQPIVIPNLSIHSSTFLIVNNGKIKFVESKMNKDTYNYFLRKLNSSITGELTNDGLTFDFEAAYKIYDSLLKEVFDSIETDQSVLIYGSDLLGLPIWALPRNKPKSLDYFTNFLDSDWMINDYSFAYYFPVNTREELRENYKNEFIGFGNPYLDSKYKLPRLPSAENEMIQLALFSGESKDNIFIDQNATKMNLLAKLSEPTKRFAIGTHSISYDPKNNIYQPSLLFSGEDSILTPDEIFSKNINIELVLLTSCNTSDYKDSFDFTLLPRSFLVAGAKTVIFSNWELESLSTSRISEGIFKNLWLNKNLSTEESLRLSIKEALRSPDSMRDLHPKFWAGMSVAYGTI
tara:strand:- start:1457 stop:4324 length:2868 start_codon:yes stop_codon:yes gene_type:complete